MHNSQIGLRTTDGSGPFKNFHRAPPNRAWVLLQAEYKPLRALWASPMMPAALSWEDAWHVLSLCDLHMLCEVII